MEALRLVVDLITGLAWPVVILALILVFRHPLRALLSREVTHLKAGPFEAQWREARAVFPGELRAAAPVNLDELEGVQADISPKVAVLERYSELVKALGLAVVAELGPQPPDQSVGELMDLAEQSGLIMPKTKESLVGVTVMRNLAAHSPSHEVTPARAREFVALADAAAFALRHDLKKAFEKTERSGPQRSEDTRSEGGRAEPGP